ncbi:transcription termination/antitermination factor NusG [Peptoanaerobacter stomatis]|uniref:Transcription termination/antitermination factor NusG n=1 Tax=Peptoanaerobacter stomatis TaxID=796937 RepID=J6HEK4_9FIRM|nr:transcription termination/antitermination NusG family protein [Peptoanaerobacter stomatis]EJU21168.1 transcription termination/antitermination factor NusG [Peptoanaerobacter stomatis]
MFVLRIMSGEELTAKKLLEDKGYKVICPRKLKVERNKTVERIIFTGYLFLDINSISDRDYYKIKDTVNVISFLDSKYNLSETDEKYIRLLNNNDKALDKIDVYFDKDKKAIIYMNEYDEYINTKNVIRVNARDKTITFRFNIDDIVKDVTFNYNEIA